MEVTVVDEGPCRKTLQVKAPAEAVAGTYAETLQAYVKAARLPGFRQGKAPVRVVESRFSKEITAEAKDRVVPKLYRAALEQKGIKPVAIVEVKDVTFDKERGVDFSVTVDVAPDFRLPAYHQIPVTAHAVKVDDADVDKALQQMRERLARFEAVTDRPLRAQDLARVDFDATCDGQPLAALAPDDKELASARDFLVLLGDPEFLPGLNAGLTGAALGEQREVSITFPADYRVAALGGRTARYQVTIKEVRERILPPLEGEFLKMLGVENEAALRERIRTDLLEQATEQENARKHNEIARQLLAQTEIELPQSVIDEETRRTVRSMVQDVARRGASRDQIVEQQDNIVSHATRTSTERVKLGYILGRIAKEEHIQAEPAEVEARVKQMAERYSMPPERMREELVKRDAYASLGNEIMAEKTMAFLLREAKIQG